MIWKGRESIFNSLAFVIMIISALLMFFGVALLQYTMYALLFFLLGFILMMKGMRRVSEFSAYLVTNRRLIEVRRGRVVRVVDISAVPRRVFLEEEKAGKRTILRWIIAGITKGLTAAAPRLSTVRIRDREGRTIFTFRRVMAEEVKRIVTLALRTNGIVVEEL